MGGMTRGAESRKTLVSEARSRYAKGGAASAAAVARAPLAVWFQGADERYTGLNTTAPAIKIKKIAQQSNKSRKVNTKLARRIKSLQL